MKFKSTGTGKDINDYYNHYITVADAKAGAILAITFVLIDYCFKISQDKICVDWLVYIPITTLVLSVITALIAVFPRTPSNKQTGVLFWEEVREFSDKDAYATKLSQLDQNEIEKEYADQNYIVSKLLHKKHTLIAWSMGFSITSILLIVILKTIELNA